MPVKKPVKKKPVKKRVVKKKTLKLYSFGFQGVVIGGSCLVLAYTLAEARRLLREKVGTSLVPWIDERKTFSARPQVLHYDDGDY